MQPDKRLYAYTMQFSARFAAEDRLRSVIERNFGARDIEITCVPLQKKVEVVRPHPRWRPRPGSLAEQVMSALDDGKAHLLRELIETIGTTRVAGAAAKLASMGAIDRMQHGVYVRAGVTVRPPRRPLRMGPALRRIYDLLETPQTAVELREMVGVTRQAIEQTLKRLMNGGLIKRVDALGERGQHLYIRAEQSSTEALVTRSPNLREPSARILSSLPPDAPARVTDVIGRGPASMLPRKYLHRLEALGLVEFAGARNKFIVTLTNRGREHPQYALDAPKVRRLAQSIDFDQPALEVLLTIHALGAARSLEITLATGIGRHRKGRGRGTGNYIQGLEKRELIEETDPSTKKGHPRYRLTKMGLALIASLRGEIPFPDPNEVRLRLEAERTKYVSEQVKRQQTVRQVQQSHRAQASRAPAIIAMLKDQGPLDKHQINALLAKPFAHPRSIDLVLQIMHKRGQISKIERGGKKPALWAIPVIDEANRVIARPDIGLSPSEKPSIPA